MHCDVGSTDLGYTDHYAGENFGPEDGTSKVVVTENDGTNDGCGVSVVSECESKGVGWRVGEDIVQESREKVALLKMQLTDASVELEKLRCVVRRKGIKVEQIRTEMQKMCQHSNVVFKREGGHYGERYGECEECRKIW
jgi:hypothetical protein